MLLKGSQPDLRSLISRELEYQTRRGLVPTSILLSPEAHEVMRLAAKVPQGSVLLTHDEVPIRVDRRMIGVNAWRITYATPAPVTEAQIDRRRQSW